MELLFTPCHLFGMLCDRKRIERKKDMQRSSGILMHISSLPSPYGIGSLGKAAFAFVDFLKQAGQRYWQVLPLGPTGYGDSPYQSFSSHAGNPYFIDLDDLIERGVLRREQVDALPFGEDASAVDFGAIFAHRRAVLREAFCLGHEREAEAIRAFYEENEHWLRDYALFMALKSHFGGRPWVEWEDRAIRMREPEALRYYEDLLWEEVRMHVFLQYLFFCQWQRLHAYCRENGVRIIGDLPIYVPLDSADVWAAPELFQLDEERLPSFVAGVPPDYFSKTGQLWGNPLYNWEAHREQGYGWWMRRIASAARLFDMLRIDHFRGFSSYWRVPYGAQTAMHGEWLNGPGLDFISAIQAQFPALPIIAEDLGMLSSDVYDLLRDSGLPGMKVLQFAFSPWEESSHLPHRHERNCVCYTGTHDNETAAAFLHGADPETVAKAVEYLGLNAREGLHWGMIRGGMSSVADLFVCQMQDALGLNTRMNTPGTLFENWQWRMLPGVETAATAKRLARMARQFGRS